MNSFQNSSELKYELLPESSSQYDLSFKIIIIGDSGVGKSCWTMKAIKNHFEDYYTATVGFEFFSLNIKINDKNIKLQIWDTCGQEIYRSLIKSFYRNSSLAIMVYSIDNELSFSHLEGWLKEAKSQSNPDIGLFLVGNKSDLEDTRKINPERAQNFYKENNLNLYLETSAKTGDNAKEVFIEAAKYWYREYVNYNEKDSRVSYVKGNVMWPSPNDRESLKKDIIRNEESGCC